MFYTNRPGSIVLTIIIWFITPNGMCRTNGDEGDGGDGDGGDGDGFGDSDGDGDGDGDGNGDGDCE